MKVFRILCIAIGSFLLLDTLIVAFLSNYNLGVILPAILGLPLLLVGIFLPRMNGGFPGFLKWAFFCCYGLGVLLLLILGGCMLSSANQGKHYKAEALIVLGAAVHGDRVTLVLSNRLDTACDYLDAFPKCLCVVSGGRGAGETVTEASAMAAYLIDKGIEPERILLEEQATSTAENFTYSMALLKDTVGEDCSVAFVTTGFHVFRARLTALKNGVDARGVAAPDVWYLAINNFLRECVGICWYAVKGWI